MLLYCCAVLMFVACKENPSKEVEKLSDEISTTKEKEAESTNSNEHLVIQDKKGRIKQVEAKYKAFKFKNTKAIFKVDEDYLLLDIPISDVKLEIEEVKNISSNNVNAIF